MSTPFTPTLTPGLQALAEEQDARIVGEYSRDGATVQFRIWGEPADGSPRLPHEPIGSEFAYGGSYEAQ